MGGLLFFVVPKSADVPLSSGGAASGIPSGGSALAPIVVALIPSPSPPTNSDLIVATFVPSTPVSGSGTGAGPCPLTISQQQVAQWVYGEANAPVPQLRDAIAGFDRLRPGDVGAYPRDQTLPAGAILVTNFHEADGEYWRQLPVSPIIHSGSFGMWQTLAAFQAPTAGACMTLVP